MEAAIQRLPACAAAVVGVGRCALGRGGHAFVEMTAGLTLDIDALNAQPSCRRGASSARSALSNSTLPLTPSGKVHKVALRWAD